MNTEPMNRYENVSTTIAPARESSTLAPSAVSWGAILAGAAGAAALSLILVILGTGLGLSSISPWANSGISASTLSVSTILWITLTQLFASGLGGYLAGRLRTKWRTTHTDEVYFRDTAHGFLAWAVASLATAALFTSTIGSILDSGVQAGAKAASSITGIASMAVVSGGLAAMGNETAKDTNGNGSMDYFVDFLFRQNSNVPADSTEANNALASGAAESTSQSSTEVMHILANAIEIGSLPAEEVRYMAQLIAQRAGITQEEAEKRVADTYSRLQAKLHELEIKAKDAADKARKASAYTALWLFISLLIGAFGASLAGTYGGRRRDMASEI